MDNEFGDKTQPSLKSKFVDVRIVLTDLEYIEPISRAVSNFDLSNFNVIVSSIIPTNDVELAKTAVNGADLILIAIENSEGDELFNAFKKELKSPYNFIEPLNLPSLERLNSYEDNVFEDEIANSIIRGGLFSISSLSAVNNAKRQYFNLKDEYESLDAGLSEYREYAKRMYDNCGRVNSVGIFGESQAGKSFLVSTLISDKNGNSTIQLGNRKLDFIRDINPQGSGKESTGVVTRFSTHERCHENEKKFELVLLKELEIAKIIVNSYFNDLKDAKANLISQNDVNEIIKKVPSLKCSEREFTSYDVVSLKKYIEENYPFLDEIITERYWQIAKSTVGTLSIENRADYFSCLWNRKKLFTDLYISLTKELKKLNFAERVLVDETAVAPGLHNDDSCLSIINVDALNGLLDQSSHNQSQIDVFVDNRTVKIPLSWK